MDTVILDEQCYNQYMQLGRSLAHRCNQLGLEQEAINRDQEVQKLKQQMRAAGIKAGLDEEWVGKGVDIVTWGLF